MFSSLDASNFSGSIPFYEKEFELILSKIAACYQQMLVDQIALENDENKIRDALLLNYLKNDKIRRNIDLLRWHFEREAQEDHTIGRTDIKVISHNTFTTQDAYYILECKRLDNVNTTGTTGLNGKYIENGICRFVSKYYLSYHRVNGMIGFIVEQLDIHANVSKINDLLANSFSETTNTIGQISRDNFITDFEYHYHSAHMDRDNEELKIYHLMLDLKDKIQP